MFTRSIATMLLLAAATPALAHTGHDTASGLLAGISHPMGGLDHVLAMVSVGLFATLLGGRALWALPASFVGMMLVGGLMGLAGVGIPAVEIGIAASVVVLGAVVSLGWAWPVGAAMALVGLFAIFHGYAHGAEIPAEAGAALYSAGFALASMGLHGLGIALGLLTARQAHASRLAGAAVAVAGIVLLAG
ncbi:HupE/UreJ family protein [Microvirga lotononidis]|uniref:Hydrogenase/urease accessory protein n=1 Tax=Microvirga lotononidis TaxID=864069 RepID=I4YW15_9HYPH|nr:HupE/UreJ family protein [Microvirga lotononidis]EIM28157.1 hydrogenase/urease accessory protein [Microvirga lotononidis]WQO27742.1 HupE/UreJ family protein [Microvirga lotononidis]